MTRNLADALLPPEFRQRVKPRKPYVAAGTVVTCEAGHVVGVIFGDVPRKGDEVRPFPEPMMELMPEHAMLGAVYLDLDNLSDALAAAHHGIALDATDGYSRLLATPAAQGRCALCGARWWKPLRNRAGEYTSWRVHVPGGWVGERRRAGGPNHEVCRQSRRRGGA